MPRTVVLFIVLTLGKFSSSVIILSFQVFELKLSIIGLSLFKEPPKTKSCSIKITDFPEFPKINAAKSPVGPEPITKKSQNKYPFSDITLEGFVDTFPNPAAFLIMGSYNFSQKNDGHLNVL